MKKTTKIIIFVTAGIIILYDIVIAVLASLGKCSWDATISHQITTMSMAFPFIATVFGALFAHFFFSSVGKKLFGGLGRKRFAIWISIAVVWFIINLINLGTDWSWMRFISAHIYLSALFGFPLGLLWYQEIEK